MSDNFVNKECVLGALEQLASYHALTQKDNLCSSTLVSIFLSCWSICFVKVFV